MKTLLLLLIATAAHGQNYNITWDGDSLTAGLGLAANQTWPAQFLASVTPLTVTSNLNNAVSGKVWRDGTPGTIPLITTASAQTDPTLQAPPIRNVLFTMAGTNDLTNTGSAATVFSRMQTYFRNRSKDWIRTCFTITPSKTITDLGYETQRTTLNTSILGLSTTYCEVIVDPAGDARLQNTADATYYQADQIHYTAAGCLVVAQLASAALQTYIGSQVSIAAYPTTVPFNTSGIILTLGGVGTSWGGGTTFTVSGVTGVSKTSQSVASTTAATLIIATGNFTGTLTVSDGSNSVDITVSHPGFNAVWSGATLGGGAQNSGDSWLLMDTVNGIRSVANDNNIVGTPCGVPPSNCGRAVTLWALPPDISTTTLINGLPGFGDGQGQTNLGLCTGGHSIHTGSPFTYNGKYALPQRCTTENYTTLAFSTSHDDWTHLFRAQDATAVSAGSCAAGAATLTTSGSTSVSGDLVMISRVGVVADREYTLTSGSNATTLKFSATCTGGSFTTGSAIGPGSAVGVPYTVAMWDVATANNMGHPMVVNYCADNLSCSPVVDSNDTYLNGVAITFNTYVNPIAFRVLKTDVDQFPGDPSKYTYRQADGTYGALATAVESLCTIQGSTSPCPYDWTSHIFGVFYATDSALPDGGQYIAILSSGQLGILTAPHYWGPWTFVPAGPMDNAFSPPLPYITGISAPSLYSNVSSSPYVGNLRVQVSGYFVSAHYQQIFKDLTLTLKPTNQSPIFNTSPTPGIAGNGGQFHHSESGLVAYWDMRSPDLLNLKDTSINGTTIPIANTVTPDNNPLGNLFLTSPAGIENTNPTLNTSWESLGGAWALPTGFGSAAATGLNMTDFSSLVVGYATSVADGYLIGGPIGSNAGFSWQLDTGNVTFSVRGTSIQINCPAPAVNTWFAYIGMRKGSAAYCFKLGTSAPTSGGNNSSNLGSYNLRLGSASDLTIQYWKGSIGSVLIWNRALCSTQVASTCAAGQVDEVLTEFKKIQQEAPSRGWTALIPANAPATGSERNHIIIGDLRRVPR